MFLTLGSRPWRIWKSHWNNRSDWFNRRISFMIVAMLTFAAAIPYLLINRFSHYMQRTAFNPEIQLDLDIPFVAWMVIPYLSLYLYYPAGAWMGHKTDTMWRQNIVFHQMMLLSCWMCFFCFLLFPVEIDLRHLITGVEGSGWESWMGAVHGVDKPWNTGHPLACRPEYSGGVNFTLLVPFNHPQGFVFTNDAPDLLGSPCHFDTDT